MMQILQSWLDSLRDALTSPLMMEIVGAVVVVAVFAIIVGVVYLVWTRVMRRMSRRTKTEVDDIILRSLRRPVLWGIFLFGLFRALMSISLVAQRYGSDLSKIFGAVGAFVAAYAAIKVLNGLFGWYLDAQAEREGVEAADLRPIRLLQKIANIVVLGVAVVMVLNYLGVKIGALAATLGIGGLAAALALQDVLGSLFSGIYLGIDRPLAVGDFIKLESGEEGFVEEIGWRHTKIRLWANNIVIVPNIKLAQSTITNYYLPKQELSVYIPCGVAYDSDLEHVERVVKEVAKKIQDDTEGASKEWEPVVRWKEFADFSINFVAVLRVTEFGVQYALQSEFIKALHRRFNQEGIEIPFPIRTVVMKPPSAQPPPPPTTIA